ncbi:MAG: patatin-like phospholipase family protein, partial [Actinomycetota bacterium]
VELIEDLAIPTAVVVTDALVGVPKILTQGAIGPALQASAAIPGVFPPVKIEACLYVDGGVTANVPVRQAIAFGARSLIVCNANPSSMPGTLPDSVIGAFVHASQIMLRNQRADATEDLVGRYPILNLPQATPASQSSFDFANSAQLMEIGYDTSRDFLSRLPELTDASPPPTDAEEPVESPPPPAPRPAVDDAPPSRIAG